MLQFAGDLDLQMGVERFFPDPAQAEVKNGDLSAARRGVGVIDRAVLSPSRLELDPKGTRDLVEMNPGCLVVQLGKSTSDGLRESLVGANTTDEELLKLWKGLLRRLRRKLKRGATVVNTRTGDRADVAGHCYSDGALRLSEDGIRMLAIAGDNEFLLGTEHT